MQRLLAARGERLVISITYIAFLRQCPSGTRYDHAASAEYAEFAVATDLYYVNVSKE